MSNPAFGTTPVFGRNPLRDPILWIPVMALILGLVAAWRYWDNPDSFSNNFDGDQTGFGDLLAELDAAQQDPAALAADIDSSEVLENAFSESSTESDDRISPGRRGRRQDEREVERKTKSSEEILKLLSNASKSPTGGGTQASQSTQLLDSGERGGTRLSLGQFRADGSFQGRTLSLSPDEREAITNAAFGRFRAVQLRNEFISQGTPQLRYDPQNPAEAAGGTTTGVASISLSTGSAILGGAAGYNSRIATVVPGALSSAPALGNTPSTPGYGAPTGRVPTPTPPTTPLPGYGSAPVGQLTSPYTTPGYGLAPTTPSVAGAGPLVPATSGPGYTRGLRNYQLNAAPPPSAGLSIGVGGGVGTGTGLGTSPGNRPLRSLDGAGSLGTQPQPNPSGNIGGRGFSSFSNPYGR